MTEKTSNLNIPLLYWMQNKINDCPIGESCSGDCGEIHCILCKHNVLSTEELKETVWSSSEIYEDAVTKYCYVCRLDTGCICENTACELYPLRCYPGWEQNVNRPIG